MRILLVLMGLVLAIGIEAEGRPLDYDQVRSDNAFRDGVLAFQTGQYNKAVLGFEQALRFKPAAREPRKWLGEALWASGLNQQALNEWHHVLESGVPDDVLAARVEVLEARLSLLPDLRPVDRYLPLYDLEGASKDKEGHKLFQRPTSVRPLPDGGYFLTAFGSESVLQVNAAGRVTRRLIGAVGGLRGPFDLLPWKGHYYVSEFTTNQIAIVDTNGLVTKSFGSSGSGDGQFLGPQFLATDGSALYVTDWGNARISKFDQNGVFLLSFGTKTDSFEGLKSATGIAANASTVYVCDKEAGQIDAFDTSGNWLAAYGAGRLAAPEWLRLLKDGRLLVSDGTRVYFLDTSTDTVVPFDPEWNQGVRVTSADLDANHNLVLADFDDSSIRVLAEGNTIYSGLAAHITRVNTQAYPKIVVTFVVQDRWGRPVTGLELSNFRVTESKVTIVSPTLAFQGFRSQDSRIAVVVDQDPSMAQFGQEVGDTVGYLTKAWADRGGITLVGASMTPLILNQPLSSVSDNQALATSTASLTKYGKFDLAVRQAAASMIPGVDRRTVVYLTSGSVPQGAFSHNGLAETMAYLKNNGIVFSVISTNGAPVAPELTYLAEQTGGKIWSARDDLSGFLERIQNRVVGTYALSWKSPTPGEAGTRLIPVSVEIQKFKQSGRAELSFFAPQ